MSDPSTENLPEMYKKLIENELAKTEEEKAEREKWMKESHTRKKFVHVELHETPENIIKIMNLMMEIGKTEKTQ